MRRWKFVIVAMTTLLPHLCEAFSFLGANLSVPLITKVPSDLHGYQLMFFYVPENLKLGKVNLYFDGGFSQFWTSRATQNTTLTIFSIAPVVRYTFEKRSKLTPYIEASIGAAYLNHTHFEKRNLGMHVTFQDRAGIGATFGSAEQFSVGLHAVHYSNGTLCGHNSGITIPVMLDVGYRFR